MENKKEKEKQEVERELSFIMEKTLELEDELNNLVKVEKD
jgi:hypothetical protein